jgi:hypothetical protein
MVALTVLTLVPVALVIALGWLAGKWKIPAALARNPIRGPTAAVPMITKGGLETITQHLAMEYAKTASA